MLSFNPYSNGIGLVQFCKLNLKKIMCVMINHWIKWNKLLEQKWSLVFALHVHGDQN